MASTRPLASAPSRVATLRAYYWALTLVALVVAGCSSEATNREQILARANDAFAAVQYEKAEKDYREVLRLAPGEPTALRQLALLYADQGQLLQAHPLLKKSAELRPDDAEVQLRFGLILLALGEPTQAREAAIKVLEQQPGDEQALLLLADSVVAPPDVKEIQNYIEGLRQKDRDRAGYRVALGALALRQKNQNRAESEFKAAIEIDPKSGHPFGALGLLYWSRNDLKAAHDALRTAADLSPPPRSATWLRYTDFLIQSGSVAEARTFVEDINRKFPEYLPSRVALMKIACAEKRDDDCVARVKSVLAQDPTNFDAVLQDGMFSLARGDTARAIRSFEYLSKIFPRNSRVRYQLALAHLHSSKGASEVNTRNALEAAESYLDEAIKLDPRFEQAVLLFAELKIRKGSSAAAIDPLVALIKERPQLAQAHYLLATAYLADGRNEPALTVYQQMTELFPQDPQPSFVMGTIWLTQRQPSQARQAFEKALDISSEYLPAMEMLVDLDIAEKQYAASMDRVQRRLDKDPNRAAFWALRGKLNLAQQNLTQAELDLLKSIELDANLTSAYVLLARVYLASNQQQKAIEELNASIEKNKTIPTLMLLAEIHLQLKNFSAARDSYESVLTLSRDSVIALNNLAALYSEQFGQLDRAHDLAKRALEINAKNPNVADTLGWILFKKGDYGNALRLLQQSAATLPGNPEIQFHLGMAHYMLGEEQNARVVLQKVADASSDFPGKPEALSRLALLSIDVAAADDAARANLRNHLTQHPNDPVALIKLAAIQERDGDTDSAIKSYEKVVADNPSFRPAIRRLALLYSRRPADNAKAFDFASRARQAYPDDAEVAKTLGILYYRRELYPRAVELLQQVAAVSKSDSELLFYLGDSHRHLKQWSECKLALESAARLKPPPALSERTNKSLQECADSL